MKKELIFFFVILLSTQAFATSWDGNWLYKIPVFVHSSQFISETVSNDDYFILVDLNSNHSDFWTSVRPTGSDVRFIDSSQTIDLNYYFEDFNYATQRMLAWVKLREDLTTTSDANFWIYFGYAFAEAKDFNQANVLENYAVVYDFNQLTGTSVTDKSLNNWTLSNTNTPDMDVNGYIGSGIGYKSSDSEYSKNDSFLDGGASKLHISMWFRLKTTFNNASPATLKIFEKTNGAGDQIAFYLDHTDGTLAFRVRGNDFKTSKTSWTANTWFNIMANYDADTDDMNILVNGSFADGTVQVSVPNYDPLGSGTTSDFYIGSSSTPDAYFDGNIDQVYFILGDKLSPSDMNVMYYSQTRELLEFGSVLSSTSESLPPVATLTVDFNNDFGFISLADVNQSTATLRCVDSGSGNVNYIVTVNDVNVLSTSDSPNLTKTIDFVPDTNNGVMLVVGECINESHYTDYDTNSITLYHYSFNLINEETGSDFNLNDINSLRVYSIDRNESYDLKANSVIKVHYFSNEDEDLRFELGYDSTCATQNYFRDFSLGAMVDLNMPVCIPSYCPTFYEHFLASNTERRTAVRNKNSDCYNTYAFTDDAYQTYLIKKTYLLNMRYDVYAWQGNTRIILTAIDGSVESVINLDTLILGDVEYDVSAQPDAFGYTKLFTNGIDMNTFVFNYRNIATDNIEVTFQLYDGTSLVFTHNETGNPNNITFYYYYGTTAFNNQRLRMVITKTKANGTTETTTEYVGLGETIGMLASEVAIILAFILLVFALTFVARAYAMGWFGIIACLIALAILTLAIPVWYITFAQIITGIIMVYIVLIFKNETVAVT